MKSYYSYIKGERHFKMKENVFIPSLMYLVKGTELHALLWIKSIQWLQWNTIVYASSFWNEVFLTGEKSGKEKNNLVEFIIVSLESLLLNLPLEKWKTHVVFSTLCDSWLPFSLHTTLFSETQSLVHARNTRQVLCQWATPLTPWLPFLKIKDRSPIKRRINM